MRGIGMTGIFITRCLLSMQNCLRTPGAQTIMQSIQSHLTLRSHELRHEISNNVVCVTSKASDQPAHMCSLIRAFASHLNIL